MKVIALIIALFGIFILGLLMLNLNPVEVDNLDDLRKFEINTKVKLEGEVIEERVLYEGTKLIKIGNLEIICDCKESFKGKEVRVTGAIEEFIVRDTKNSPKNVRLSLDSQGANRGNFSVLDYNRKRQVRALKVEILEG